MKIRISDLMDECCPVQVELAGGDAELAGRIRAQVQRKLGQQRPRTARRVRRVLLLAAALTLLLGTVAYAVYGFAMNAQQRQTSDPPLTGRRLMISESGEVLIDALCEPTADVIAAFAQRLSPVESDQKILRHFGYFLGRWIYLIDALDDLDDDLEDGSFNPLALRFGLVPEDALAKSDNYENARCFGNDSLNLSIAEAIKYYELLDLGEYKPILDNIMYLGVSEAQRSALFPPQKRKRKRISETQELKKDE